MKIGPLYIVGLDRQPESPLWPAARRLAKRIGWSSGDTYNVCVAVLGRGWTLTEAERILDHAVSIGGSFGTAMAMAGALRLLATA